MCFEFFSGELLGAFDLPLRRCAAARQCVHEAAEDKSETEAGGERGGPFYECRLPFARCTLMCAA